MTQFNHFNKVLLLLFVILFLLSAKSSVARAAILDVSLTAIADTYVADSAPSDINGSSAQLSLGYDDQGEGAQRILLQFDIDGGLPDNAQVVKAELQLYVEGAAPDLDPGLPVSVYEVTEPWSEVVTNWNNQPDFDDQRATGSLDRFSNFYPIDITGLAQDWVNGDLDNNGLLLIADANSQDVRSREIASRESSPSLFRPRLTISFVEDDTPPQITVDPLPATSNSEFTVSWSGDDNEDGSGLDSIDVQVRINRGDWEDWITDTDDRSATYTGSLGVFYEFRARGTDKAGNEEAYGDAEASTLVGVPSATITPFATALALSNPFTVQWAADGDTAGIVTAYDIYVNYNQRGWTLWLDGTTATQADYTASSGDGLYAFEAVARGGNGLRESFRGVAEATIALDQSAPFVRPELYFPLVSEP